MDKGKEFTVLEQLKLLLFFVKKVNTYSPIYIPLKLIQTIFNSCIPVLVSMMPGLIIDELSKHNNFSAVLRLIIVMVIIRSFIALFNYLIDQKLECSAFDIDHNIELSLNQAFIEMRYENLEKPEIKDLGEIARSTKSRASSLEHMISSLFVITEKVISLFGLIMILINLVKTDFIPIKRTDLVGWFAQGTIPCLLFVFVLSILAAWFGKCINKMYYKYDKEFVASGRAYKYYGQVAKDFRYAKDIRLFGIYNLISERMKSYLERTKELTYRANNREIIYLVLSCACLVVQTIFIYVVITCKILVELITIGEFYTYISAVSQFGTLISVVLQEVNSVQRCLMYQYSYKEILTLVENKSHDENKFKCNNIEIIEFKNVTFTYPGATKPIIKGISFSIKHGVKTAIVGRNGSGKSTLVKLLLGLYEPDEGQILINGIDLKDIKYSDYIQNCTAVFQDFNLFAFSVEENIALTENIDKKRIDKVIKESGLDQLLQKFPSGTKTQYSRRFEDKGVDFSGGESQKIAIARALYKDAELFILDEPTSALDPIAERDFFHIIQQQIGEKTAVFVSHRLSSCCLCDNILVIDDGKLVQCGSHSELLSDNGLYRKMWEAQSKYYFDK